MDRSVTLSRGFAPALCLALAVALPAAAAERFTKGLLWRVAKPGAAASHVFGAIHLADPRVLEIDERVLQALGESRSFAMETPHWDGHHRRLYEASQYQDGRRLESIVGTETAEKVRAALAPRAVPDTVRERIKPWAALANIAVTPEDRRAIAVD